MGQGARSSLFPFRFLVFLFSFSCSPFRFIVCVAFSRVRVIMFVSRGSFSFFRFLYFVFSFSFLRFVPCSRVFSLFVFASPFSFPLYSFICFSFSCSLFSLIVVMFRLVFSFVAPDPNGSNFFHGAVHFGDLSPVKFATVFLSVLPVLPVPSACCLRTARELEKKTAQYMYTYVRAFGS